MQPQPQPQQRSICPLRNSLIIYAYEIRNLIAVNKANCCTVILILILFVDTTLSANRKKISETRIIYCIIDGVSGKPKTSKRDNMCPVQLCIAAVIQVCAAIEGTCAYVCVLLHRIMAVVERKQTNACLCS